MDLVRRARAGDPEAFVALMEHHKVDLYKVARSYLHSDADAADAMQEAVLTCFEKLPQLRNPTQFKTWLTRILINKCNDRLREQRRVQSVERVPERACEDQGRAELEFLDFLEGLDEKYRVVLLLYYGEGFRVREIAALLALNEETVKTRLKRGRAGVKAMYERGMRDERA